MNQFSLGTHVTAGGHEAIVARLGQIGGEWALKGAIRCPFTLALTLNYWSPSGVSLGLQAPEFNLQAARA